ncbi:MAG: hypothetical protein WC656_00210 [Sulfurimonas sp.]|jgi:hypothetical protein
MNQSNFCSFTVCNAAYLHKALSLAESYHKNVGKKINIFLFDKKRDLGNLTTLANIFWIEDLNIENLEQLAFKYDIIEFSTSLKPFLAMHLLETYDKVIFFDPDTFLFNNIDSIIALLDEEDIVVTPHYITPQKRGTELTQSDTAMMRFGSFNLGFFAIRKSDESLRFLKWWDERCQDLCYVETQFGLATDQKWVAIAPCFFPSLHISFNLGLNVAFWNLHERKVTVGQKENTFIINEKFDLIFFHFSSFNEKEPLKLIKKSLEVDITKEILLHQVINKYSDTADKYKKLLLNIDMTYSYDFMDDGSYISPSLRRAYAGMLSSSQFPIKHNPFDVHEIVGIFAKKNFLLSKTPIGYTPFGSDNIDGNKWKFYVVNTLMKILLYLLGPNQFTNISRLLVFLSSYRLNTKLWKI